MEITIGREPTTQKLAITVEKKNHLVGKPMSVPISVSREHCTISIADDGTMKVKNLKPENVTYVNGTAVISKTITRKDVLELGDDRYRLDWNLVDGALPKEADVRPLREVWHTYNDGTKALAKSTQRFQVTRSIVPVFTMSAVLIGYLSGGQGSAFYLIYAFVIALTIFFLVKAWRDIDKNDKEREMLKERFQDDYCCPCCGYFFGFSDYAILMKNTDYCPKCKTKLRK